MNEIVLIFLSLQFQNPLFKSGFGFGLDLTGGDGIAWWLHGYLTIFTLNFSEYGTLAAVVL